MNEYTQSRRARLRETIIRHIIGSEILEQGLKLSFAESDSLRATMEIFVTLERQCCGFLTFSITPPGEGLVLRIDGPAESCTMIHSFIQRSATRE